MARPATVRRRRCRAMAALATLLILVGVLALTVAGVSSMVTHGLRTSHRRVNTLEAQNLADAGIDLAIAYLQAQPAPPTSATLHPLTDFFGTNGTIDAPFGMAGSRLRVAIFADVNNPGPTQKHYLVESQATLPGGVTRTVRAYLKQISFGKYAFFADIDSGGFWDYNNHFEGPFHSNASDGVGTTLLWKSTGGTTPMFAYQGEDAFSCSADVTWWKNTIGSVGPPTTAADFATLASGGYPSMANYGFQKDMDGSFLLDSGGNKIPKSPRIPLPSTDYQQAYVALGQDPPANPTALPTGTPTALGATVTPGGGIYIHGSASIQLVDGGAGRQIFEIVTTSGNQVVEQRITADQGAGTATVVSKTRIDGEQVGETTTSNITGGIKGLVFADDNITALSGEVADRSVSEGQVVGANAWTIATDLGAGKDILVTDSITYKTRRNLNVAQRDDDAFNQNAGTLGLLARNIHLKDGAPAQVEVDAMMFCTGTWAAQNPLAPPGSSHGKMVAIGGVIVKRSGVFAYAKSDGTLHSGWEEQYHYDTRMADSPPPYFPTTGNHYAVQSYQVVTTTLN